MPHVKTCTDPHAGICPRRTYGMPPELLEKNENALSREARGKSARVLVTGQELAALRVQSRGDEPHLARQDLSNSLPTLFPILCHPFGFALTHAAGGTGPRLRTARTEHTRHTVADHHPYYWSGLPSSFEK